MKYLFMAGGTGGHVYPALAVAGELHAAGAEVYWLGTRQGFEARAVPAAGIPIEWIDIRGLRGTSLLRLLLAPLQIVRAVWQALAILRRIRPGVVVGMGGYASGPGGLAAWMLRIPLLIHEQNARAGTTNRILSRLAQRVLQAYPGTFAAQVGADTVGNPVRSEITAVPEPAARDVGRRDPAQVLVLGGSQGALALNTVVPAALGLIEAGARPRVRHQAGRTLESARAAYASAGAEADLVEFIEDMSAAYQWADLVVCRAGALTLAELASVGVAAVLVPFPAATDDHQTRNAEHLVAAGAARLMPESAFSATSLAVTLLDLLADPAALRSMAVAARGCAHPDATARIVAACRELCEARS